MSLTKKDIHECIDFALKFINSFATFKPDIPEAIYKNRYGQYHLSSLERKKTADLAEKIYKIHGNEPWYTKTKAISELANTLGFPVGFGIYSSYLQKYEFSSNLYRCRVRSVSKEEKKEICCLLSLGFTTEIIAAAIGVSTSFVLRINHSCNIHNFSIEQKKEVYLKYEKYLSNVVTHRQMILPFSTCVELLQYPSIVSTAEKLVQSKTYYSLTELISDIAREVKYPITSSVYTSILRDNNFNISFKRDTRRSISDYRTFEKYTKCLLSLGIGMGYIRAALGYSCTVKPKLLESDKFTIEELKEAYNCNPGYLDAVAEKLGIDLSIVQNEENQNDANYNADSTSDIPIKKHMWYLKKFGGMTLSELSEEFNLSLEKIKEMFGTNSKRIKFTENELIRLQDKYKIPHF